MLFAVAAEWVYAALRVVLAGLRSLYFLQALNAVLGAICAWIVWRQGGWIATCLLAFGATWWKFSTDANAYIVSVLFLLLAVGFLADNRKPKPIAVALLHACAMLMHELAVLFVVVALFGIWRQGGRRVRNVVVYLATAFVVTSAVYFACFRVVTGRGDIQSYASWIAYHTPDSHFSFQIFRSAGLSLLGTARLFAGGGVRLFQAGVVSVVAVVIAAAAVALLWRLRSPVLRSKAALCGIWVAVYALFLLFWMPQNTFYRLFYWPPLAMLSALWFSKRPRVAAVFIPALVLWNFLFFVYPRSRPESNRVLTVAEAMRGVWKPGAIVFEGSFHTDNWLVWYFNPEVIFKDLDGDPVGEIESAARMREVWLEQSGVARLRSTEGGPQWLTQHTRPGGYAPRFTRVTP